MDKSSAERGDNWGALLVAEGCFNNRGRYLAFRRGLRLPPFCRSDPFFAFGARLRLAHTQFIFIGVFPDSKNVYRYETPKKQVFFLVFAWDVNALYLQLVWELIGN